VECYDTFVAPSDPLNLILLVQVSREEALAYFSKHPHRYGGGETVGSGYLGGWKNMVPARFVTRYGLSFSPIKVVNQVCFESCPPPKLQITIAKAAQSLIAYSGSPNHLITPNQCLVIRGPRII